MSAINRSVSENYYDLVEGLIPWSIQKHKFWQYPIMAIAILAILSTLADISIFYTLLPLVGFVAILGIFIFFREVQNIQDSNLVVHAQQEILFRLGRNKKDENTVTLCLIKAVKMVAEIEQNGSGWKSSFVGIIVLGSLGYLTWLFVDYSPILIEITLPYIEAIIGLQYAQITIALLSSLVIVFSFTLLFNSFFPYFRNYFLHEPFNRAIQLACLDVTYELEALGVDEHQELSFDIKRTILEKFGFNFKELNDFPKKHKRRLTIFDTPKDAIASLAQDKNGIWWHLHFPDSQSYQSQSKFVQDGESRIQWRTNTLSR